MARSVWLCEVAPVRFGKYLEVDFKPQSERDNPQSQNQTRPYEAVSPKMASFVLCGLHPCASRLLQLSVGIVQVFIVDIPFLVSPSFSEVNLPTASFKTQTPLHILPIKYLIMEDISLITMPHKSTSSEEEILQLEKPTTAPRPLRERFQNFPHYFLLLLSNILHLPTDIITYTYLLLSYVISKIRTVLPRLTRKKKVEDCDESTRDLILRRVASMWSRTPWNQAPVLPLTCKSEFGINTPESGSLGSVRGRALVRQRGLGT